MRSTSHPAVINGCSELFAAVFGKEAGIGAAAPSAPARCPRKFPWRLKASSRSPAESLTGEANVRNDWYRITNEAQVDSPALLVFPDRIGATSAAWWRSPAARSGLRPHVKTYKMAEVVRAQMTQGIGKFKCATIAEAEMLAGCVLRDVLFAYQAVGPKIERLLALGKMFRTRCSRPWSTTPKCWRRSQHLQPGRPLAAIVRRCQRRHEPHRHRTR